MKLRRMLLRRLFQHHHSRGKGRITICHHGEMEDMAVVMGAMAVVEETDEVIMPNKILKIENL